MYSKRLALLNFTCKFWQCQVWYCESTLDSRANRKIPRGFVWLTKMTVKRFLYLFKASRWGYQLSTLLSCFFHLWLGRSNSVILYMVSHFEQSVVSHFGCWKDKLPTNSSVESFGEGDRINCVSSSKFANIILISLCRAFSFIPISRTSFLIISTWRN